MSGAANREKAIAVKSVGLEGFDADYREGIFRGDFVSGVKTEEYRSLKQTTLNKYTYIDEADGKRYLRRFDAIRFYVGYHSDRDSAVVQVLDTTYEDGLVTYHLGKVLEVIREKENK